MNTLNQPINSFEKSFNDKFGHSQKILCCNARLFTQLISSLLILDAILFYIQTYFRWGAPCFLWWNTVSTTITFMFGHGTRLVGLPVCVYAIMGVRKNKLRGTRMLFYYLLFASLFSALDVFLSLLEVHNVCNSNEIYMWNDCSHEWGKQEYNCVTDTNEQCLVGLTYDNMEIDKRNCLNQGCNYIKNEYRIKPECCGDSMWLYHNPCSKEPVIREKVFDTDWCENFSDFYDVGVQLVTTFILFGFAYAVNSYNILMDTDLKFTPNTMGEE